MKSELERELRRKEDAAEDMKLLAVIIVMSFILPFGVIMGFWAAFKVISLFQP